MLEYLENEEKKEIQCRENFTEEINQKLVEIQNKLDKLLEGLSRWSH